MEPMETDIVASSRSTLTHLTSTEFARRPQRSGTLGRQTQVVTNFFKVDLPEIDIYQYDVVILPEVPPLKNRLVWAYLEKTKFSKGERFLYDGRSLAYSLKDVVKDHTFNFVIPEDNGSSKRPPQEWMIRIRQTGCLSTSEILKMLDNKPHNSSIRFSAIQALDIMLRQKANTTMTAVKASFFTPNRAENIGGGLEVWSGIYQSLRPAIGQLLLNVDTSICPFYRPGNLATVAAQFLGKQSSGEMTTVNEIEKRILQRAFKNLSICVKHRGEKVAQRRYKIAGLSSVSAAQLVFESGSEEMPGKRISVVDYFYEKYNIRLQYPNLPCVTVRKVNYPMEVCEVLPGQRYFRKLDEQQTAALIKITCVKPEQRLAALCRGIAAHEYADNEYVNEFGVKISQKPLTVDARVLPVPQISYHPSSTRGGTFAPQGGSWNMMGNKVCNGATLKSWGVVSFANKRAFNEEALKAFIRELCVVCQDTGMPVVNRQPPVLYGSQDINAVEKILREIFTRAGNAVRAQPQLLICILPNTGSVLYGEIKRVTDTILGVSSQCIQMRHAHQAKKQYCANVCLKINSKLGGTNVFLPRKFISFISEKPTIVMGADVNHPAVGDNIHPSFASVTASVDALASKFSASLRAQGPRVEIIADLENMVTELFKTFFKISGAKPARILFYRDGVSEGQFSHVMENEIKAIESACENLEAGYKPSITFIVVGKRHHMRVFPQNRQDADRSGNCNCGTVVDNNVVHPQFYDFYLLSHPGLQGTSRPTHYTVLKDDNNLTIDEIQSMTYNLCHIYARCTRVVSIVPAVYYAHLVGRRARYHTTNRANDDDQSSTGVSTTAAETETMVSSYCPVAKNLCNVMYFM